MALDDAVQTVRIEGTEEAISAFKSIGEAGAQAFSQIIEAASHGDLTGLATMFGGELAGSIIKATEAVMDFTEAQSKAIEKTVALGQAFGATLSEMAGLKEAFAAGGVSATALDRVMQRMSMQVAQSWSSIQASIRTSATASESALEHLASAHLAVEKAQQHLSDQGSKSAQQSIDNADNIKKASLSLAEAQAKAAGGGKIPAGLQAAFDMQKQSLDLEEKQQALAKANAKAAEDGVKAIMDQKQAILGLQEAKTKEAEAEEHQHQQQLKDIPSIITAIKTLQDTGSQKGSGIDLMDVSIQHIIKGFQAMASQGGQMAKPIAVMQEMSKAFAKSGEDALTFQQKLDILAKAGGGSMARMGSDLSKMVAVLSEGPEKLAAFTAEADRLGLALGKEDTDAAKAFTEVVNELGMHWDEVKNKFATAISPMILTFLKNLDNIVKSIPSGIAGIQKLWAVFEQDHPGLIKFLGILKEIFSYITAHPVLMAALGGAVAGIPGGPVGMALGAGIAASSASALIDGGDAAVKAGQGAPTSDTSQQGAIVGHDQSTGQGLDASGKLIDASTQQVNAAGAQKDAAEKLTDAADKLNSAADDNQHDNHGGVSLSGAASAASGAHWRGGFAGGGAGWRRSFASGGAVRIPGYARGGLVSRIANGINIPGFANGGLVPGFDAGGMALSAAHGVSDAQFEVAKIQLELQNAQDDLKESKDPKEERKIKQKIALLELELKKAGVNVLYKQAGQAQMADAQYGHAEGGHITGPGSGTSDSIVARLSNGEFVMRSAAVRAYGASFFHALNDMKIGGFAEGGMVHSPPRFATGGGFMSPGGPQSSFNLIINDKLFGGLKASAGVAGELKSYAISQQTTQTGRAPSWQR